MASITKKDKLGIKRYNDQFDLSLSTDYYYHSFPSHSTRHSVCSSQYLDFLLFVSFGMCRFVSAITVNKERITQVDKRMRTLQRIPQTLQTIRNIYRL